MDASYLRRLVDPLLDELLAGLPAVLLVGPRASGKTTTARRRAASLLRLDRPGEAGAVRADADAALAAWDEPVLIDEWQLAPEVLAAVKRAVDDDPRPGRFLLTGSSAADLTIEGWPATGRVVRIPLWGLTEREIVGDPAAPPFLTRLLSERAVDVRLPDTVPDLRGYLDLALRGAFPEVARQPSARVRRAWLASYVDHLVARDIPAADATRDAVRLRRYLQAAAANTAGVVEHKTLYDAAGVNRLTGVAYDAVLQSVFISDHVPAWSGGQLGRLISTPKRYLADPALVGPLLGLDPRAALRDADLLGRLIDTFVLAQLRAEVPVCDEAPRLYHIREPHGRHEIDLLAEYADGRIVAFEIKAASAPTAGMATHLAWLRDRLGERFVVGVLFHTGPRPIQLGDRLLALPICAMWG